MLGRKNDTKLEVNEYTGENSRTHTDEVSKARGDCDPSEKLTVSGSNVVATSP